jgi:hypothetical protein
LRRIIPFTVAAVAVLAALSLAGCSSSGPTSNPALSTAAITKLLPTKAAITKPFSIIPETEGYDTFGPNAPWKNAAGGSACAKNDSKMDLVQFTTGARLIGSKKEHTYFWSVVRFPTVGAATKAFALYAAEAKCKTSFSTGITGAVAWTEAKSYQPQVYVQDGPIIAGSTTDGGNAADAIRMAKLGIVALNSVK